MSPRGSAYRQARPARRPPRLGLWVGLVAAVVLVFGSFAEHIAGVLLLIVFVAVVAYTAGVSRRPAAKVTTADPPPPELADAKAEAERLRAELAEARASAQAAWDQAASRPPRAPAEPDAHTALLDQPMSGVHPLGGRP